MQRRFVVALTDQKKKKKKILTDQVIRENPASRVTETSAAAKLQT